MDLSVIIPCKKEAENIAICVTRVSQSCPGAEIIVVDSGLDETRKIIESLQKKIPHLKYIQTNPDRGKGDAIRQGIENISRSVVTQIDADLQFLPEEIPHLIQPILEDRADMTLGSRFTNQSIRESGSSPFLRSTGNFFISQSVSFLFGQKISDALAGMKAWKRSVTESFSLTSYHFSYEVELFAKALRNGFRVIDVPVSFEMRKAGESKVSVFKAGCQILKDAIRFRYL